jgi:hypothetical protein
MIRGEATVTLKDGRTLTLAMGFRALALASSSSGIPTSDIFSVLQKDDGRQMLATLSLIHGALNKYHRDISQDDLDVLMMDNSEAFTGALSQSMLGAFGDEAEEETSGESEGNGQAGILTNSKKAGRKQV